MSYVKPTITERNGIDLEYREEINPFNDIIQCLGIIAQNEIIISGGVNDPSQGIGFTAPIGSFYACTNGNWYKKIDITDTDWEIFSGGGVVNMYLKDLIDVDNTLNPRNRDLLRYVSNTNQWETGGSPGPPSIDYGGILNIIDGGRIDYGGLI